MTKVNPKRVLLLVDDDKLLQRFFSKILVKKDYEVLLAPTYEEALSQLKQHEVDLCILDLALPGKSGLELFQTLRQNPKYQKLPVVVQSGFGDQFLKEILALEPLAFLHKPFPMEELLYVIEEAFAPTAVSNKK